VSIDRKLQRVLDYLDGGMEPFAPDTETMTAQAVRVSKSVISVVRSALGFLPVGGIVTRVVSDLYILSHYGPLAFYSSEIFETITLVAQLVKSVDTVISWHDLAIRIYYVMAEQRAKRLHQTSSVSGPLNTETLKLLVKYCALAVHVAYETSPVDAQRLLRLQGYTLVLAETSRDHHPYFLACREKEAVLILPGTRGLADLPVDMNAFEKKFGENFSAHTGVGRAAKKLHHELCEIFQLLEIRGFGIRIVGHSLGAAIGSVLTGLLKSKTVQCYGFGSPPCVLSHCSSVLQDKVTNVVFRDDLVSRTCVSNVKKLFVELVSEETSNRVKTYMQRDFKNLKSNWSSFFFLNSRSLGHSEFGNPSVSSSSFFEKVKLKWFTLTSRPTEVRANFNDEKVLDRMIVPGKVLLVDEEGGMWIDGLDCRLARIELQTEMINDHSGDSYFRAIVQMVNGRKRLKTSPSNSCACCASDFLWNSILKGEPHVWFATHVCRKCGAFVCDSCSKHYRAVPEQGHLWPVRHCDSCWLNSSRI
jgi:hypothetical protein